MLLHWSTEHAETFAQHGHALETIHKVYNTKSPCELCGQIFRQQHHCVLLGQAAMCTTAHCPPAPTTTTSPTVLFTCDVCRKAYVTRHGLRDHIQKYHNTLAAEAPDPPLTDVALHEMFHQAVLTDDNHAILQDPAVLSYLGTTCALCSKTFAKRNILTRHLRHHHASLWIDAESQAVEMNQHHRPFGKCFCIPVMYRLKHICLVFQQYCMYRLHLLRSDAGQYGYAPGLAGESLPLGPAAVATPQQHAVALLFHGHVDQLYSRTDMRMVLTLHCLFCMRTFRAGEDLMRHAAEEHPGLWTSSRATHEYFRWLFFSRSGCLCNPGPSPGDNQHVCAPLRQMAMLFLDFGMPLCIPFAYRARDLVDLLLPLMTFEGTKQISNHLMMRQFARLWQHRELTSVLRTHCLVCQEMIRINDVTAHLEVAHDLPLRRFGYHMEQLAQLFVVMQSDEFACDFCGTSLDVDVIPTGLSIRVMEHLRICPFLLQFAVLLNHPTWEYEWQDFITWPNQAQLLEQHRQRDMRLWQYTAQLSAHPSASYFMIAQCGKWYLDDALIKDMLNNTCLMCGKFFVSTWKFLQHLLTEHDFHQMDTEHCHSLLVFLTDSVPCDYCGSICHATSPGKRCIALFNLAVYLCNSYGLRRRRAIGYESGSGDLETHPATDHAEPTADDQTGVDRRRPKKQKTENQRTRKGQQSLRNAGTDSAPDQNGAAPRGLHQRHPHRITIYDSLQSGGGNHHRRSAAGVSQLATEDAKGSSLAPPTGQKDDGHPGQSPTETGGRHTDGPNHDRLRQVPHRELTGHHALLGMECQDAAIGADGGQASDNSGGIENLKQHPKADDREGGHGQVPQSSQVGGNANSSSPMAVAGVHPSQPGIVARDSISVLSQFLAVGHGQDQATDTSEVTVGSADQSTSVTRRVLRILLNLHGTVCFANATMLGLAWMAICCNGMHAGDWQQGFALICCLTEWTPLPLNLQTCDHFLALLDGYTWGPKDLAKQQDLLDFVFFILPRMMPGFLHCGWVTQPGLHFPDLPLDEEKGPRFQPLRLILTDLALTRYPLQSLINDWHDALGHSRAFEEASLGKCLVIDRAVPPFNVKCLQQLDIGDGRVQIPIFDEAGTVHMYTYRISALVFHLGLTPAQGHYRCAIQMEDSWLVYDDGRLPDRVEQLPNDILQQTCLFWLTRVGRTLPCPTTSSSAGT